MTASGSAGDGAFAERRARFDRWRRGRPFLGGALLILASFAIAWIPINIAPDTILLGKALSPIGLLFAALVFLCGIFALTRPELADVFGLFGIVFSIFSLYGALGGFGIGLALGLVGGNLCYAWEAADEESGGSGGGGGGSDTGHSDAEPAEQDEGGFVFEESNDDGPFGTRSAHSTTNRVKASSGVFGTGARLDTASVSLLVLTVVVLGIFAHPLALAAADPFPDQSQVGGTVIGSGVIDGQGYDHENVTTDTSNRDSVSAARISFRAATIQRLSIYKNFRTDEGTPYHLAIRGTTSNAPDGLAITSSEFYAGSLTLEGVVPAARNQWSTCPGRDFLLSNGDIGNPDIRSTDVATNTHRMSAPTVTVSNLNLTVQEGAKSSSVTGTPTCTPDPTDTALNQFTPGAIQALIDAGRLDPNVTGGSVVSSLDAPDEVDQGETFNVSATVTNTGLVNDTQTVEYRFAGGVVQRRNVTLGPNESTTVRFEDTESSTRRSGTYEYGVATENSSVTGTITINGPAGTGNETAPSNETGTNATPTRNATNATTAGPASNETGTGTTTAGENTTTTTATNETTTTTPPATSAGSNRSNTTTASGPTPEANATGTSTTTNATNDTGTRPASSVGQPSTATDGPVQNDSSTTATARTDGRASSNGASSDSKTEPATTPTQTPGDGPTDAAPGTPNETTTVPSSPEAPTTPNTPAPSATSTPGPTTPTTATPTTATPTTPPATGTPSETTTAPTGGLTDTISDVTNATNSTVVSTGEESTDTGVNTTSTGVLPSLNYPIASLPS